MPISQAPILQRNVRQPFSQQDDLGIGLQSWVTQEGPVVAKLTGASGPSSAHTYTPQ